MQNSLRWVICTVMGAVVCVSAGHPADKLSEREFEIPKLKVGAGGDQYAVTSNIALICSVAPAIETDVDIKVCHLNENGELVLMSACKIRTDARGRILASLGPPFGQWRAGRAVILYELSSWRQSRDKVEIQFAGQNVVQDAIVEPIVEAKSVFDVSKSAELKMLVESRQRFLVRGLLQIEGAKDRLLGPSVVIELYEPKVNAAGQPSRRIVQSGHTITVRTKDGNFGFEAEVKAPSKAQNYLLKVRPLQGTVIDARKSPELIERILAVQAAPSP